MSGEGRIELLLLMTIALVCPSSARAVFTLQGSSVASERVFSRAKYVNARRFSLTPERFERFVVTAANTRAIANRFPGFRSVDLEW